MNASPATLVAQAIDQATAIKDPTERARAIIELQAAVKEGTPRLKEARKADVTHLKQGRTLREVAELLGCSVSLVEQILSGRVTGRRANAPTQGA